MSILVDGKPIATWPNQELRSELDVMVCTIGTDRHIAVMAEALSRCLGFVEGESQKNGEAKQ